MIKDLQDILDEIHRINNFVSAAHSLGKFKDPSISLLTSHATAALSSLWMDILRLSNKEKCTDEIS